MEDDKQKQLDQQELRGYLNEVRKLERFGNSFALRDARKDFETAKAEYIRLYGYDEFIS